VFTLGIFTAVKEFTYLSKFLVNVNINTLVNAAKDKGNLTTVKAIMMQ